MQIPWEKYQQLEKKYRVEDHIQVIYTLICQPSTKEQVESMEEMVQLPRSLSYLCQ